MPRSLIAGIGLTLIGAIIGSLITWQILRANYSSIDNSAAPKSQRDALIDNFEAMRDGKSAEFDNEAPQAATPDAVQNVMAGDVSQSPLPSDDSNSLDGGFRDDAASPDTQIGINLDAADLAARVSDYRQSYDDRIAAEPTDSSWSYNEELRLQEDFLKNTPYGAASIDSIVCKTTMCKLVATNSYENLAKVQQNSSRQSSSSSSSYTHLDHFSEQEGFVVTIYTTRDPAEQD